MFGRVAIERIGSRRRPAPRRPLDLTDTFRPAQPAHAGYGNAIYANAI